MSCFQQNGTFDEIGFANVIAVDVCDNIAAYHALVLVHLAAGNLLLRADEKTDKRIINGAGATHKRHIDGVQATSLSSHCMTHNVQYINSVLLALGKRQADIFAAFLRDFHVHFF